MKRSTLLSLAAAAVMLASNGAVWSADTLTIGVIANRSGPASDVGEPHGDGVLGAWKWQNEQGGIAGHMVKIVETDCAYNVECTKDAVVFLTEDEQVPLIHGYGTPDSIAVNSQINRTNTVYLPLSYAEELMDAETAPYMFVTNASYSTAGRSAVQFVHAEGGSLALVRSPQSYGMAPIPAIKDEAARLGVDITAELDFDYVPTDAVDEVLRIRESGATHIWMGNTTLAMSVLATELARQGVDAKIIGNIYSGDEAFIRNSGDVAEGHFALFGSVQMDDPGVPMIDEIKKAGYHDPDNVHYIRGWAQGLLAGAAIRQAAAATSGKITGDALRQAMYDIGSFSVAGLVPPISFSPNDHHPNMVGDVYRVEDGRWEKHWENTLAR